MSSSPNHHFDEDLLIQSFRRNSMSSPTTFAPYHELEYKPSNTRARREARDSSVHRAVDERPHSVSRDPSYARLEKNTKCHKLISALKDKILSDNVPVSVKNSLRSVRSSNTEYRSPSRHTVSQSDEDDEDDEDQKTYRNEIYKTECVVDTRKVCHSYELNQLPERHVEHERPQKELPSKAHKESAFSDSSDSSLERKFTQVFHANKAITDHPSKQRKPQKQHASKMIVETRAENKENLPISNHKSKELKLILETLKKLFPPLAVRSTSEMGKLYDVVKKLQQEQEQFRTTIKEQQDQINTFHSKYAQSQDIIQSQKHELKQLYQTNQQLEAELNQNISELKDKMQEKITEFSQLPRAIKAEKRKSEKLATENDTLIAKLQQLKQELANIRSKLEQVCQKKLRILNKLKSAEKDLKIFRTQNSTLKTEKRTLYEEVRKLKGANEELKTSSSKNLSRQKERVEMQQRLLRKKIIDLEMELSRSRNSTNVLIEERDKLIAELHMQLNTLVHNFEVSQKHIRILRRHIYSLSSSQTPTEKSH